MAMDSETLDRARTDIRRVREGLLAMQHRVERLESLILRGLVMATALCLALGSGRVLLDDPSSEVEAWGLLTAPFRVYATLDNAGNVPATLVLVLGAGILAATVLIALGSCIGIWGREVGPRAVNLIKAVSWVLLAGTGVALLAILIASDPDREAQVGPAMWWLVAGVLFYMLLAHNETVRRLWA